MPTILVFIYHLIIRYQHLAIIMSRIVTAGSSNHKAEVSLPYLSLVYHYHILSSMYLRKNQHI